MNKSLWGVLLLILILTQGKSVCSSRSDFWRQAIAQSSSLEMFFAEHYACQSYFYPSLTTAERLYFDTVTYPKGVGKLAYQNRWRVMSLMGRDERFFRAFPQFNNYFATHYRNITPQQLGCFAQTHHLNPTIEREQFFDALQKNHQFNHVAYLYPLIRWSYMNHGRDMALSQERVAYAERIFGVHRGEVGDKGQFARYIALFDGAYQEIAESMASRLGIEALEAYKVLVILTYLESRGNLFAVSKTGAMGPLQLTLHYYMMYGMPNNPFDPKSSLAKLANKFIHYHRMGHSLDASVIAYKSGSLQKCQEGMAYRGDVDCRYYADFKRYFRAMRSLQSKEAISRYLTGKSYFLGVERLRRRENPRTLGAYEPYQYAVLKKGVHHLHAQRGRLLSGGDFDSLGRMRRSEIYRLQERYGRDHIGVISDKKVCY